MEEMGHFPGSRDEFQLFKDDICTLNAQWQKEEGDFISDGQNRNTGLVKSVTVKAVNLYLCRVSFFL